MNDYGVPDHLMQTYKAISDDLANTLKEIQAIVLKNLDMKENDIVEDIHSGLRYKLGRPSVYIGFRGNVAIRCSGKRYYKTGRKAGREAYSTSSLSFRSLKKVENEEV